MILKSPCRPYHRPRRRLCDQGVMTSSRWGCPWAVTAVSRAVITSSSKRQTSVERRYRYDDTVEYISIWRSFKAGVLNLNWFGGRMRLEEKSGGSHWNKFPNCLIYFLNLTFSDLGGSHWILLRAACLRPLFLSLSRDAIYVWTLSKDDTRHGVLGEVG